jgi:hypothetical protein
LRVGRIWRERKGCRRDKQEYDLFHLMILHDCALISPVIDFLIEAKALSTHKAAKISAQRFSVLARLIFRPAVKRCIAPTIAIPLLAIRPQLCSAPIICVNLSGQIVRVVFIFDHRGAKR